jgi:mannose-1-phosphate guanylyltransferase
VEPVSVDDLADEIEARGDAILEFLRRESMSLELYRLEAGATDPQEPHDEDEVYYVVSGVAKIQVGESAHSVRSGDVVFVERGVDHYFFDIEEDLVTLVVFAPPFSG